MPPASSSRNSRGNSNDDHGEDVEPKEDVKPKEVEPKEGVDASGGPLLGQEADESIKSDVEPVYEGELKDGKAHGRGVCRFEDGRVYDGEWEDGVWHGSGTFHLEIDTIHFDNGDVYEGELKDGEPHGKGVYKDSDGHVYDGEWKDGLRHGTGTVATANGKAAYEGEWAEGEWHGKGTLKGDGFMYDGEWKNNMKHGRGKQQWKSGDVYEGEWKDGNLHGKGIYKSKNGDVYEGEFVEGKVHGKGTKKYASGKYDGQWVGGKKHGKGTLTWKAGNSYEGQLVDGEMHGTGTMKYSSGDMYEGNWANGQRTQGKMTFANGSVYEGGFVEGTRHGRGTMKWPSGNLYEGNWVDGLQHGRGTVKWKNGDIYEGVWKNGQKTRGMMRWANGETWTGRFSHEGDATGTPPLSSAETPAVDFALDPPCEPPIERKLRSQKSLQRRLQKETTAKKTCEHCGVDDYRYKLRVCSVCNLALYCSAVCQKAASGSHRRICDIISGLPPRDADALILKYDKEKTVDLDAGLRYGTKYMGNLKHLEINVEEMANDDAAKLSAKRLCSFLQQKKGALESVFWVSDRFIQAPGICGHDDKTVWKELHGLKQLRLEYMLFAGNVQPVLDIIGQQKNTLMELSLPFLRIDWSRAKCRRTVAQAVNACKHLVKLDLNCCMLMDSDLKIMLDDLSALRILVLKRYTSNSHQFSDNTCGLIARKCPGLQELNLDLHDHLSVRGIRKIFKGCVHLRAFFTTTCNLRRGDVGKLLSVAPQLCILSLSSKLDIGEDELQGIIESTNGRTLIQFSYGIKSFGYEAVSAEAKKNYYRQIELGRELQKKSEDPKVMNVWEDLY